MKRLLKFLLPLALGCARLSAQGGPPFITDDPGTPGDKHWEVNIAWTHEHRPGESVSELPLVDINYGVGDRIQLKYEASYLVERESGTPSVSGLSNSLAGVKWRFYDDEKSGLTISTYPQLEFRNPGSNSAARGLTADETTVILPVEIQREAGGWGINAEVGVELPGRSDPAWFYGVVVAHELNEKVEVGVELHGEGTSGLRHTALAASLGVRYKLNEHCALLAAVGRELHNGLEARANLLSYLAVQLLR